MRHSRFEKSQQIGYRKGFKLVTQEDKERVLLFLLLLQIKMVALTWIIPC